MSVLNLPIYKMAHAEKISVVQRLKNIIDKYEFDETHLNELMADLANSLNAIENYLYSKSCTLRSQIKKMDKCRDMTLRDFGACVRGAKNHFDPIKAQSASYLYTMLSRHDLGAKRKGYDEQSTIIRSLLLELQTEKAKQALKECELFPFLEKIAADQDEFDRALLNYIENTANSENQTLSSLITPVLAGIKDLLWYINSRERLHPQTYRAVVAELNTVISEYRSKLQARMNRQVTEPEKARDSTAVEV
ncbi:DUF6261 family protein [Chitinispirillales bacterium ANBcel5]|uniref:DUF6261 family protein n=1 Tax=Cellulosispirillum alkaliphilum TaxID=3039283 RepID=UPI002A534DD0|nr:DUF6261 family protein [Chitinispirillales bacterium ANBcel5]